MTTTINFAVNGGVTWHRFDASTPPVGQSVRLRYGYSPDVSGPEHTGYYAADRRWYLTRDDEAAGRETDPVWWRFLTADERRSVLHD